MAIIFDLGRVVVSWDPVGIVRSVRGPDGAEALAERLFNHPDWLEVDRGTLSLHAMANQAQGRTGLSAAENLAILQAVPASLLPDPAMVSLIETLHRAGHRLYALSNMGHASIDWLEQHQEFWRFTSRLGSASLSTTARPTWRRPRRSACRAWCSPMLLRAAGSWSSKDGCPPERGRALRCARRKGI